MFSRKRESSRIPAQAGTQAIWNPLWNSLYFPDSRLCWNDTPGLARWGRGQLLHSAKMLLFFLISSFYAFNLSHAYCLYCAYSLFFLGLEPLRMGTGSIGGYIGRICLESIPITVPGFRRPAVLPEVERVPG